MNTPRVSVIVCTYNQEDTLGVALDSILTQITDFDYEIIIADDCSGDSTREVARKYASEYPDIIRLKFNERNKGITLNYFESIEEARGEYIADLAGDDQWCDNYKLARQVAILDSDPEIELTHTLWRAMREEGNYFNMPWLNMPRHKIVTDGKELLPLLLNHKKDLYFIHLCTSMYRRQSVMELIRTDSRYLKSDYWPCEDYQLEVLLAARGKLCYEPVCTLNYRVGHVSISSDENYSKNTRFAGRVMELTSMLTSRMGLDPRVNRSYYKKTMRYLAMNSFNSGDPETGALFLRYIRKRLWPVSPGIVPRVVQFIISRPRLWKFSREKWLKYRHRPL